MMGRPKSIGTGTLLVLALWAAGLRAQERPLSPPVRSTDPAVEASGPVSDPPPGLAPPPADPTATQTAEPLDPPPPADSNAKAATTQDEASKPTPRFPWWWLGLALVVLGAAALVVRPLLRSEWFERTLARARHFASRPLGTTPDSADADEVASESLGSILLGEKSAEFLRKGEDDQLAYLRAAVRHRAIDRRRRDSRTRTTAETDLGSLPESSEHDEPLARLSVAELLALLSDEEKAILELRASGMPVRAIAREKDTTPYRVEQTLARIQKRFADFAAEDP